MAIRRPRCDREYDVTLFQFGRAIHSFSHRPECGRVYREGSHTERMRKLIDRAFES